MLYSFLLIGFDLLNIAVHIFAFIPVLADDAPSSQGSTTLKPFASSDQLPSP